MCSVFTLRIFPFLGLLFCFLCFFFSTILKSTLELQIPNVGKEGRGEGATSRGSILLSGTRRLADKSMLLLDWTEDPNIWWPFFADYFILLPPWSISFRSALAFIIKSWMKCVHALETKHERIQLILIIRTRKLLHNTICLRLCFFLFTLTHLNSCASHFLIPLPQRVFVRTLIWIYVWLPSGIWVFRYSVSRYCFQSLRSWRAGRTALSIANKFLIRSHHDWCLWVWVSIAANPQKAGCVSELMYACVLDSLSVTGYPEWRSWPAFSPFLIRCQQLLATYAMKTARKRVIGNITCC